FVPRAAGIEVAGAGTRFENTIRLSPTEGGRLSIGIRPYRGLLELRRTPSGRLTVINEVDLEEYLYGVLKMEVDPEWPADALRAQAVAARTLALQSLGRFASEGYDVRATTDTQLYGGISAEDPRTTTAVEETRGEIMTYEGRPGRPRADHRDARCVVDQRDGPAGDPGCRSSAQHALHRAALPRRAAGRGVPRPRVRSRRRSEPVGRAWDGGRGTDLSGNPQ